MYVCMYVCICVCVYIYIYMCVYVCVYVCVCVCTHINVGCHVLKNYNVVLFLFLISKSLEMDYLCKRDS